MPVRSPITRNFRENTQDLRAGAHVCTAGRIHKLTRARARPGAPPSSNPASGAERRALPHPASRVAARTPPPSPASSPTHPGPACTASAPSPASAPPSFSREAVPATEVPGTRGGGGLQPAAGGRGRPRAFLAGTSVVGALRRGLAASAARAPGPSEAGAGGIPAGLQLGFHCRVAPMLRFPTCFPSFRVVGEKQLPQEIIFLVWSPKRDLIALANTTGEVSEPAWSPKNTEPGRQRARHTASALVSPSVHLAGHLFTPPLPSCPAVNFK